MRWREPTRDDRQVAWLWAAIAAGSLVLGPIAAGIAPSLLPVCALRRFVGIPCPTCGATRSMTALFRGDPLAALGLNPLVALAAVLFLLGGLVAPLWIAAGGRIPVHRGKIPMPVRIGAVAVLAANWVYLIVTGV